MRHTHTKMSLYFAVFVAAFAVFMFFVPTVLSGPVREISHPPSLSATVAAVIAGEARGEGAKGMLAVAEVIRNRVAHYKGDRHTALLASILKPKQFSCLNSTSPEALVAAMRDRDGWDLALAAAKLVCDPEWTIEKSNITFGATHYFAMGIKPPAWAVTGALVEVCVIKRHRFFAVRKPPALSFSDEVRSFSSLEARCEV